MGRGRHGKHVHARILADGYGYQWWIAYEGYPMALGFGGQYIIVVPDLDLVMVVTSGLPGSWFGKPLDLLNRYVIPAAVSETPLPEDPDAQGRLAAAVAAAAATPAPEPVTLPDLHSTLSPSAYEFDAPILPFGDTAFGLRFERDTAFLRVPVDGEPMEAEIGLDGRYERAGALPWAFRGRWRTEDTFAIDYQIVGRVERGMFQLTFAGTSADVTYSETTSGTLDGPLPSG